jgi:hypothetical protein
MENQISQEAVEQARALSELTEDSLFAELGLRAQDVLNPGGYQRAQNASADYQQDAKDMLGVSDLKDFGRRFWRKLEKQLIDLVCAADNEDRKKLLQGQSVPDVAAALVTTGIIAALAPPSWVVVLAAILARKIVATGIETLCEQLKETK